MNVYLHDNELNLENLEDFLFQALAIGVFVSEMRVPVNIFKDSIHFNGTLTHAVISRLSLPMDIKGQIRGFVFRNLYCECWRPVRCSNPNDVYLHGASSNEYSDVSAAEAASVYLAYSTQLPRLLISANSRLAGTGLLSLENVATRAVAHPKRISSKDQLLAELYADGILYDPESGEVPRDQQTILELRPDLFERTDEINKGHRVYRHRATEELYCVDDGHPANNRPHLEVYSRRRVHVGVANMLTGEVRENSAIKGRKLP